jgi:hypothetical protein
MFGCITMKNNKFIKRITNLDSTSNDKLSTDNKCIKSETPSSKHTTNLYVSALQGSTLQYPQLLVDY